MSLVHRTLATVDSLRGAYTAVREVDAKMHPIELTKSSRTRGGEAEESGFLPKRKSGSAKDAGRETLLAPRQGESH
jgi:hypothetical protein